MKTYSSPLACRTFTAMRCDVCGSARYRLRMRTGQYTFVRCAGCGVTYQNPQPSMDEVRGRYGSNYYDYEISNERNFFGLMLLGLRDIDFEGLYPHPGRLLDIGCATGMLLEHMRARGWVTQGVEICRESVRHAREVRGLDVFEGTLEEASLPSASFDVVHFLHLLEHVSSPRSLLAEVRRILVPGGRAVITTPNIDGFQARLFGTQWRSAIADHLYLFSRRSLPPLLQDSGYRIERCVTWGGLAKGTAPGWLKSPVDRLAKLLGFGDVMLYLVRSS